MIAESFERIHRSNLVGMGVLPLQFADGESAESLGLTGEEEFTITGIAEPINDGERPPREVTVQAGDKEFTCRVRIDTPKEALYFRNGGILQYVLRQLLDAWLFADAAPPAAPGAELDPARRAAGVVRVRRHRRPAQPAGCASHRGEAAGVLLFGANVQSIAPGAAAHPASCRRSRGRRGLRAPLRRDDRPGGRAGQAAAGRADRSRRR